MTTLLRYIIFFLFCLLNASSFSQNWKVDWIKSISCKDHNASIDNVNIDFRNQINLSTRYGDSIFFGDTTFAAQAYSQLVNLAISKYNSSGKFGGAFDITTTPITNSHILDLNIVVDNEQNRYIAFEYIESFTLLDTTIYNYVNPNESGVDLLLMKITPELKIDWIKKITSPTQDVIGDMTISSDNIIYLSVEHFGSYPLSTDTVNYFDQDYAVYDSTICSLLKIDQEGNLIWRKQFTSVDAYNVVQNIFINNQDHLIISGGVSGDLFFLDDTIHFPQSGKSNGTFFLKLDINGDFISGKIPEWGNLWVRDIKFDDSDNLYLSGKLTGTAYLGSDTIFKPVDTNVHVIAKTDSYFQPLWHEDIKTKNINWKSIFSIDVYNDTLFFATGLRTTIELFDTVFSFGASYKGLIGQVTPEGELYHYLELESSNILTLYNISVDNCENIVTSGHFVGQITGGGDTIQSNGISWFDGFLINIKRSAVQEFNFGPDTVVCMKTTLYGPEGFQKYYWNDSLTNQSWYEVDTTGTYQLNCVNENGCWMRDTINIQILPEFEIDIGQDTIISTGDTLSLMVPDFYTEYLWSTGSTENEILVTGDEFGSGDWNVWVEVSNGACISIDTVLITIIDYVQEFNDIGIKVFPNPVTENLNVESEKFINKVELLDFKGEVIFSNTNQNKSNVPIEINLSDKSNGIYILRIYLDNKIASGKIVKL